MQYSSFILLVSLLSLISCSDGHHLEFQSPTPVVVAASPTGTGLISGFTGDPSYNDGGQNTGARQHEWTFWVNGSEVKVLPYEKLGTSITTHGAVGISGNYNSFNVSNWSTFLSMPITVGTQVCVTLNVKNAQGTVNTVESNMVCSQMKGEPPVASNDTIAAVAYNSTAGPIDVSLNDTDSDNSLDLTSVSITSSPASSVGSCAVITSPNVEFIPAAGFYGTATCDYEICDVTSLCDTASITFIVNNGSSPVAVNNTQSGISGSAATTNIIANDTDPDGVADIDSSSVSIVTNANAATQGTCSYVAPNMTFSPVASFTAGSVSCTYTVNDLAGNASNIATVTFIYPNPPVAVDDSATAVAYGATATHNVSSNDTDADANLNTSSVTITTNANVTTQGVCSVTTSPTVQFVPVAGFSGTADCTYQICDSTAPTPLCDSADVTFTVNAGVAPVAVADSQAGVYGSAATVNIITNDTDANGTGDIDSSSVIIITNTNATTQGTCAYSAPNMTFTPVGAFVGGAVSCTYTVDDLEGNTSNTVAVTFTYPHPPVAVDDSATAVAYGATATHNVSSNDSDADSNINTSSVTITTNANATTQGVCSVTTSPTVEFVPVAGFSGTADCTYQICDSTAPTPLCDSANVTFTVNAGFAPVAVNDTVSTLYNTPINITALGNDTDANGAADINVNSTSTITLVTNANPATEGTCSILAGSPVQVRFIPVATFYGAATCTYTIDDLEGNTSNAATITVNVSQPPASSHTASAADSYGHVNGFTDSSTYYDDSSSPADRESAWRFLVNGSSVGTIASGDLGATVSAVSGLNASSTYGALTIDNWSTFITSGLSGSVADGDTICVENIVKDEDAVESAAYSTQTCFTFDLCSQVAALADLTSSFNSITDIISLDTPASVISNINALSGITVTGASYRLNHSYGAGELIADNTISLAMTNFAGGDYTADHLVVSNMPGRYEAELIVTTNSCPNASAKKTPIEIEGCLYRMNEGNCVYDYGGGNIYAGEVMSNTFGSYTPDHISCGSGVAAPFQGNLAPLGMDTVTITEMKYGGVVSNPGDAITTYPGYAAFYNTYDTGWTHKTTDAIGDFYQEQARSINEYEYIIMTDDGGANTIELTPYKGVCDNGYIADAAKIVNVSFFGGNYYMGKPSWLADPAANSHSGAIAFRPTGGDTEAVTWTYELRKASDMSLIATFTDEPVLARTSCPNWETCATPTNIPYDNYIIRLTHVRFNNGLDSTLHPTQVVLPNDCQLDATKTITAFKACVF